MKIADKGERVELDIQFRLLCLMTSSLIKTDLPDALLCRNVRLRLILPCLSQASLKLGKRQICEVIKKKTYLVLITVSIESLYLMLI